MNRTLLLLPLLLVGACTNAATARPNKAVAAMLPDRALHCVVGHAIGLDARKWQTTDEIQYEGAFPLTLHLPAIPRHVGPPPEPTDDPEPVNPATRVTDDPAGIATDLAYPLYRVVDLWPERVEIAGKVTGQDYLRVIIVSDIDLKAGTARLFTTRAMDAGSLDLQTVYQGSCRIVAGAPSKS
jgi:hypothetical protein